MNISLYKLTEYDVDDDDNNVNTSNVKIYLNDNTIKELNCYVS